MTINVNLDGVKCVAKISRIDWFKACISMAFHGNNGVSWHMFRITNIKGNPRYEDWKEMYITPTSINWYDLVHTFVEKREEED